jgi:hypothetical protein
MTSTSLAQLHSRAVALTPRSARFATKLLRGSLQIPFDVRHAMTVALLDTLAAARAPTPTEWSALEQPLRSKDARTNADVIEARLFVDACASFAASRSGSST